MTRWCAVGNHMTKPENFRVRPNGVLVRDCQRCEERRRNSRRRNSLGLLPIWHEGFPGVDIDRIYLVRAAPLRKAA